MTVYEIDPLIDERWEDLLQNHPQASVFHTRGWLTALKRTYGYIPSAFTTSQPGAPLTNGVPFCKVNGLFGNRRLVSLPFSDHCEPLVQTAEQLKCILDYVQHGCGMEGWDYAEIRPKNAGLPVSTGFSNSQSFCLHTLNLKRGLEAIFQSTHKNCAQRKIRRAGREGLAYEEGATDSLLRKFYRLLVMTRRRHGVPIQPMAWFENLIHCLSANLSIQIASKDARPIAGILTIRFKNTLVYKYGCSDHGFNPLGGMQFLLWQAIRRAHLDGLRDFDMGRSDCDSASLIAFKDRWGATKTELTYLRYAATCDQLGAVRPGRISRLVLSHAPGTLLQMAGRALYKYMG